jgi:hypothetical protein
VRGDLLLSVHRQHFGERREKAKKYVKSISIKPKAAITIPNNKKSVLSAQQIT